MNEINISFLNKVNNRFLPLPRSALEELEHEPNISDFDIIKELGEGSYAKVYLVMHKKTKVKYAIKAIDKLNIENKKEKSCFNREVEIMYKLDHPNIAKLYAHFEDNKFCYLLMQYIPNGNAYDLLIKKGGHLNLELISSIVRDVLRAIYYLHNMTPKVIHRDIKPENILLDENNNAYLIDFGWSNYIINGRRRNTICGTPIYRPPEMADDINYDESIDIWSIGILLCELSTGTIPFKANDVETLRQDISELNISWPNNIDPDIKDLCSKIFNAEQNKRPLIENILEHKFFKKYLRIGDMNKKLIKPTLLKNKIFVVSKDIPGENNYLSNKASKENINKRYKKTEIRAKVSDKIYTNDNKSNTDSKIYIDKRKGKNNIHEINYVNKDSKDIKKNLINNINLSTKDYSNNYVHKNNNYYHSKMNSREKINICQTNNFIKNNRSNHIKIYSSSLINYNKTEENKSNNYSKNYKKYNSTIINKNENSMNKNNYIANLNNYKLENLKKQTKDGDTKATYISKNVKEKRGHIHTFTNINENQKDLSKQYKMIKKEKYHLNDFQKYYTHNVNKMKGNEVSKTQKEIEKEKQKDEVIINRAGEPLIIKKKQIYI